MTNNNPFSMSTMLESLQDLHSATENHPAVPPPPYSVTLSPPPPHGVPLAPPPGYPPPLQPYPCEFCDETPLQWMFRLMTRSEEEDAAYPFKVFISKLDRTGLQTVASLLTSDPDYFLEIARNKNGSNRLQKLVGRSDDVDSLICDAILYRFPHVMTDKHASYVATRGLRVFAGKTKEFMCEELIRHALLLARDKHGCVALNEMLTDLDHPSYRNQLLDIVARNALGLSHDAWGNFVVQHVLKLNDPRTTRDVALSLRGYCIDLSFKKYGSYIVERLLEADESVAVVVTELVESDRDRLMRLARSEYGNYVVSKALRLTQRRMTRVDLFRCLVQKLMPFLPFLRKSRGSNIAEFLESVHKTEVA